jgi:hypothetical protein
MSKIYWINLVIGIVVVTITLCIPPTNFWTYFNLTIGGVNLGIWWKSLFE